MHRPLGRAWRLVCPPLAAAGAAGCAGPLARRSLGAGSLCARASALGRFGFLRSEPAKITVIV